MMRILYISNMIMPKKQNMKKPIVPSIMLMGIITSAISKHLPGPGSHVVNFSVNFVEPVFHYETLTFQLEVIKVDKNERCDYHFS